VGEGFEALVRAWRCMDARILIEKLGFSSLDVRD
jgi:hypothetical protein